MAILEDMSSAPGGGVNGGKGERGEEAVEGVRTSSKLNSPNDVFLVGLCGKFSR